MAAGVGGGSKGVGLPLALGVTAGALLSVQAFSNARLGDALGSWVGAAVLNNLLASAALLCIAVPSGSLRRFGRSFRKSPPPVWTVAVGANGALNVTVMAGVAASVGLAAMTLAAVFGQLLASVAFDRIGISPGGPRTISPTRIVALVLATASVCLGLFSVSSQSWLLLLAAVAGAGFSLQQVGMGRLREHTGEPVASALVHVGLGAVVLLVLLLFTLPISLGGVSVASPEFWCGGLLGAVIVFIVASTIGRIGAFGMTLSMTIGQGLAALGLDAAFPDSGDVPLPFRLLSIGLLLVAVGLNEVSRRERAEERGQLLPRQGPK